jgi:hypothetical protein
MKESDLYAPVKGYLEGQGYRVKGEIGDCDVVAVRGEDEPIVVELKLSLNLTVLLQVVDRLSISSTVYVGVPHDCTVVRKRRKSVLKLLRSLGVGLLSVNANGGAIPVAVLLDPQEYRPRQSKRRRERLLGEFEARVGDPNLGGQAMRRGVMTAYRQQALGIAKFLEENGPSKSSAVAKALKEKKATPILYRNVYGWFDRVSYGTYALSPRGEREIKTWVKEG